MFIHRIVTVVRSLFLALQKHEKAHRRLKRCEQYDTMFSMAEAQIANIKEKHRVPTGCRTEPERSRQHLQRAEHRPELRLHLERCHTQTCCSYWRPAQGRNRTTPVLNVALVAVKTDTNSTAVLELNDDYELN